jgi:hypothetical protein
MLFTGRKIENAVKATEQVIESVPVVGQARLFWKQAVAFKGVKVYQRNDIINPNLIDKEGRTNIQRMKRGLAPIGPDGEPVNLHHITQSNDSSIAEITDNFHKIYQGPIHINPNTIPSGIDRNQFRAWKEDYWKNRAKDFE